MKMCLKKNIKVVLAFILGSAITGSFVYATVINSIDIKYDNTNSGISSTNMQGAIDELYTKAEEGGSCSGMKYTVTYDACSGTGAPETTQHQYGVRSNISNTKPTKGSSYNFLGWSKTSCSGTVDYTSGAEIALMKEGDITTIPLYAIYAAKTCEYKCSNGFYATYTNGTMTSCRYSGNYGSAVCNKGPNDSSNTLYMCQASAYASSGALVNNCNRSLGYYTSVNGGGCPSSYTCP